MVAKIRYKQIKYKKWLDLVKEYTKNSTILKKNFFSITITKNVLNKIKEKTGYTPEDFNFFLKINTSDKKIPKKIKKKYY